MRSRFLRAVVEAVHQEAGGTGLVRLREGLPAHLRNMLYRDVLAPQERDASVDLEPAMDLLLSIDRVLCGGSGVVTTRAAKAQASRVLSQSPGLVVPGDTAATLQHLRAPFEQPFIDTALRFSARRSSEGFVLDLQLASGRPSMARWLASAGLGYASAAASFSGESASRLRLYVELTGDVARVLGRHTDSGVVSVPSRAPTLAAREERMRTMRRRSSATNVAAQVDQILSRATPSSGMPAAEPRAWGASRADAVPPGRELRRPESGTRPASGNAGLGRRKSGS